MKIAARLLWGYQGGLSLETIRHLPASDVQTLFFELPRLQAQDALLNIQIASFPHYSGTKSDKNAGNRTRKAILGQLQAQAYGSQRNLDSKGRRILRSPQEFRQWLGEHGIAG